MINEKVYQIIFNEISRYLPDKWEKVVIYLEHWSDAYSYSFFVKTNNGYVKCYDLNNIDENELYNSFSYIENIISEERDKNCELWSNMTLIVDKTGDMKCFFDYTDFSNGNYEYKKQWKSNYLI